MIENWLPIAGYEGIYEVSDHGRVRNCRTNKVRKPEPHNGYMKITLSDKGRLERRFVHRLVACAFIKNDFSKPIINHKDGVKDNNHVKNLEWCTESENHLHAYRVLHIRPNKFLTYPFCSVHGCAREYYALGLCRVCYDKKRNGTLTTSSPISK